MPSWKVTAVDRGVTVPVREDQTLLDALHEGGIDVVWGCRYGACRTCAARHVGGRIALARATALTDAQVADHYVLLCQTWARGDCEVELGDPHGSVLPVLPWTE